MTVIRLGRSFIGLALAGMLWLAASSLFAAGQMTGRKAWCYVMKNVQKSLA